MKLRKKMLTFLASLVGLLVVVAVLAIWALQGVLSDLDHTGSRDAAIVEDANRMGESISLIEIELREIQLDRQRHLDTLIDHIEDLRRQTADFEAAYQAPLPQGKPYVERILTNFKKFECHIGMLATTQDPHLTPVHMDLAMTASVALRQDILAVGKLMRQHVASEQTASIAWFRWLVLALAVVFLILINVSVMMLLRMAGTILRPVDRLVEASRRLAAEDFDHRVALTSADEFDELANAYNTLASQLQTNERRKLETLAQAAVTLNHELNNASAIIRLQLQLLQRQAERQSPGNPAFERALRQINDSLARMTATVEALKHVRRIVLTDYTPDIKMLDLSKSTADDAETIAVSPTPAPN